MKIQREWSSFKITLLLYAIIFIIPLTFYFVYSSFNTLDADTKVLRHAGWLEGTAMTLTINPSDHNNQQMVMHIDETLQELSVWVTQNNDSEYYLGGQTLTEDLSNVITYWDLHKQILLDHDISANIKENSLKWNDAVRNLTVIIENMVYLKQNKLINMFYWNLAATMLLTLLLIYMVRVYIHKQMKKHAIHDNDSKLFNKKYFMSELKISCSRSTRHNFPLSMLCVSIDHFEKGNQTYNNMTKRNTLKAFGILIHSFVRDGDVPCRYDENQFFILLPFTEQENALILEERIRQALEKDNWMRSKKIAFTFKTTEFDKKESEEAFILRTLDGSVLRG